MAIAIYHVSIKSFSRGKGESSTAAAAYRAGMKIEDERTGLVHDDTRRAGVESVDMFLANATAERVPPTRARIGQSAAKPSGTASARARKKLIGRRLKRHKPLTAQQSTNAQERPPPFKREARERAELAERKRLQAAFDAHQPHAVHRPTGRCTAAEAADVGAQNDD